MTDAVPLIRPEDGGRRQFGAVEFLTTYLILVFVLPARLIVTGTGSLGTPATLLGIFGFGWWVVATLVGQRRFVGFNAVRWALFGYLGVVLLSWTLGKSRALTVVERTSSDRTLLIMVSLAGVALVAIDGLATRDDVETVVRRLLYCVMVMVMVGTVQFYFGYDATRLIRLPGLVLDSEAVVGSRSIFNRPFGTALHPIEYGVVSAALVPLAYWMTRIDRRARFTVITVALAFAAMSSVSRSAVLAIGVAVIVLILGVSWRERFVILGLGVGFIVFVGVAVKGLVGTLRNLFTAADNDSSVQVRIDRIPKVLKLISEYPYFGRGFGSYNIYDYFLLDNELQKTTIETGFIGVAVLIAFIGFVSVAAWRTRIRGEGGTLPGTALAATILGLFISSYTFDAFFYRILTGVLYLSIGIVGALYRITAKDRSDAEVTWFQTRLMGTTAPMTTRRRPAGSSAALCTGRPQNGRGRAVVHTVSS